MYDRISFNDNEYVTKLSIFINKCSINVHTAIYVCVILYVFQSKHFDTGNKNNLIVYYECLLLLQVTTSIISVECIKILDHILINYNHYYLKGKRKAQRSLAFKITDKNINTLP